GKEGSPFADYLQARLLMTKHAWGEARARLEKVRTGPLPTPALVRDVNLLLADCYERLGSPDQRVQACQYALDVNPQWGSTRHRLAQALAAAGKLDRAIGEYAQVVVQAPESQTAALREELAELLLRRNLCLPAETRRWAEVEDLLEKLPPPRGHSTPVQ